MSDRIPASIDRAPEITITIGGEKLRGWDGATITRSIDSCADAFALSFPWDPTADNIRRFRPFQYQPVVIEVDGETLLTGTIDRISVSSDSGARAIQIDGRSASGVLADVSAGPPWQYEGVKFSEILRTIGGFCGVSIQVPPTEDTGALAVVEIDPGQTAFDFLSSLGVANGLNPRPLENGSLQFTRMSGLAGRAAIADLEEGADPVLSISTDFDATKRFSRYDVIQDSDGDALTASATDDIPAVRVKTVQPSQQSADLDAAAKAARARGYLESFSAAASVTGWTYNGTFWAPGGIVTVNAPGAMLRDGGRLIIRQATYRIDGSAGQVCDLALALPESVSNSTPRVVPWFD
jgi:prophage tail gpP-like protein